MNRHRDCVPGTQLSPEQHEQQVAESAAEKASLRAAAELAEEANETPKKARRSKHASTAVDDTTLP